jgi:hypothetical protein
MDHLHLLRQIELGRQGSKQLNVAYEVLATDLRKVVGSNWWNVKAGAASSGDELSRDVVNSQIPT